MNMTSLEFLRKVDFLEKVSIDILDSLVSKCPLKELKKGEVLFKDEEEGGSMYVILSGELMVSKNGVEIARRYKGDYIGEMSLVGSTPRSATVASASPTLLLEITQEQFSEQLSLSPDALLAIMRTLSDRARDNLRIFKTQDSVRDRSDKAGSQGQLEEHVMYLMQEAGLTSREADVARLICDGLSDKAIAERLGLSPHTVKDYLKRIYAKFRVHARAQLVSLMFK
jgi:CRP/FNR family transcriptional regulator, cyclic AMP receptor protein